jgi:hypothetical protein
MPRRPRSMAVASVWKIACRRGLFRGREDYSQACGVSELTNWIRAWRRLAQALKRNGSSPNGIATCRNAIDSKIGTRSGTEKYNSSMRLPRLLTVNLPTDCMPPLRFQSGVDHGPSRLVFACPRFFRLHRNLASRCVCRRPHMLAWRDGDDCTAAVRLYRALAMSPMSIGTARRRDH